MPGDLGATRGREREMQKMIEPQLTAGQLVAVRVLNFVAAWPLLYAGLWLFTVALIFTGSGPESVLLKLLRGVLAAGAALIVALAVTLLLWAVLVRAPRRWFTVGAPLFLVATTLGAVLAPSAMPRPLGWL